MKAKLGDAFDTDFLAFDESDLALEWCENRLLVFQVPPTRAEAGSKPEDYELFRGFSETELAQVIPLLERCRYQPGEVLIRNGERAEHLYLLARGQVSVWLPLENDTRRRLATVSAGMAFGEMAIIDRAPRSALVIADTEVECDRLSLDAIQSLESKDPRIKIRLLENLAQALSGKLRKANRELAVLD